MHTFGPNTLIESSKVNDNFIDLSTGDADTDANSIRILRDEAFNDFVKSGGIWSADSLSSSLNGTMSAAILYINGRRLEVSSVTARAFTASRDTYVFITDNLDGTASLVYTEVTNNANPPAIPSDSIQLAMLVTNGSSITKVFGLAARNPDEVMRCTILAGVSDTLIVPNILSRKYLEFRTYGIASGGTLDTNFIFNNDTGSNYAHVFTASFSGTPTSETSRPNFPSESGATDSGNAQSGYYIILNNDAAEEKNYYGWCVSQDALGGAVLPTILTIGGKWANTSSIINRLTWTNAGTGDFGAGSEIIFTGRN